MLAWPRDMIIARSSAFRSFLADVARPRIPQHPLERGLADCRRFRLGKAGPQLADHVRHEFQHVLARASAQSGGRYTGITLSR